MSKIYRYDYNKGYVTVLILRHTSVSTVFCVSGRCGRCINYPHLLYGEHLLYHRFPVGCVQQNFGCWHSCAIGHCRLQLTFAC